MDTMHDIDLSQMTFEELSELEKDVAKAMKTYTARKKKEALAAADSAAREHGFSLSDLSDEIQAKPVSAPKYQHPENPALTWTGRGRRPKWFIEAIEGGSAETDLLIS